MTIKVYYSSATSDLAVKKNQQSLRFLLDKKKAKFEEIDLAQMQKPERDALYEKAGSRVIPLVFVNGTYVGVRTVASPIIINIKYDQSRMAPHYRNHSFFRLSILNYS